MSAYCSVATTLHNATTKNPLCTTLLQKSRSGVEAPSQVQLCVYCSILYSTVYTVLYIQYCIYSTIYHVLYCTAGCFLRTVQRGCASQLTLTPAILNENLKYNYQRMTNSTNIIYMLFETYSILII